MEGITVLVSVIESPPHVSLERNKNGTIKSVYGYLPDIWFLLEKQLKFVTEYVDSKNLGHSNNGTWDGIIGDLHFQKADVGLLNLGITSERQKVIDFSAAIDFDSSKLLKYATGQAFESIDWLTYVRTFSWDIWCCIGLAWVVTSIILAFATSWYSEVSYFQHLFALFGVITNQGSEVVPERYHGRLIFLSFLLMVVVLYASFTALLTTHLTTASDKPVQTLYEALDLGFRVSLVSGSMQHQAVLESKTPEFLRVKNLLEKDPSLVVASQENGIQSTYDERTLFLFDSSALRPKTASNCSFSLLLPSFFSGYLYFGYRKGFKYQETINKSILKLMSSGMIKKLALKWLYPHHTCTEEKEETLSLGVRKAFFAFSLVMGGTVLSTLILLLEICIMKSRKKRIDKNKFKKLAYIKELKLDF